MGVFLSRPRQKSIGNQTVVITGASSGIGLATAKAAVAQGARVVLAARSKNALEKICLELNKNQDCATFVVCDVTDYKSVERVRDRALEKFGGFDTWVNAAGISLYGAELETSIDDEKRVFDVNFWGTVYGSKVARHFLKATGGGSIINIGSLASMRAFPLQGAYCASKHAVKSFTEVFRMEVESGNEPISITLVLPSAIGTPFAAHAKSVMGQEPQLPPPIYDPQIVASAVITAAQKPLRRMPIGGLIYLPVVILEKIAPSSVDRLMVKKLFDLQKGKRISGNQEGCLYRSSEEIGPGHQVYGNYKRTSLRRQSVLSELSQRPRLAMLFGLGFASGMAALILKSKQPQVLS